MYFLGLVPPELAQALAWTPRCRGTSTHHRPNPAQPRVPEKADERCVYKWRMLRCLQLPVWLLTAGPVVATGSRMCRHFIIGGTLVLDDDIRTLYWDI